MATTVTPASLLSGLLSGLATRVSVLQNPVTAATLLQGAIDEAVQEVQRELSTRVDVTRFVPYLGAGAPPVLDQTGGAQEHVDYYQWPGALPGDGFPRIQVKHRPLQWINSAVLYFPGALITNFTIPLSWMRVDRRASEIVIAPTGNDAVYALALAAGGFGWRTPQTLALDYAAGLGPTGLAEFPGVDRMVAIRSLLRLLPTLSGMLNPTSLSSISADGLSQSRSSGYVFKDWEERLKTEADDLKREILDQWEGPAFMML